MKKVLLTLTAVAGLTFASKAQEITGFQKGNFIVEGSIQANTTDNKNSEVKTSNFNFVPKAGYFVTDKIAVGVQLGVGSSVNDKYSSTVDTKKTENSLNVGVFGRYYFLEVGSRFKTYAEVGVDYANANTKTKVNGNTSPKVKADGFGVNGSIGANYFLTDKIAINFAFANVVGYKTDKVKGAKSENSFNADINNFNNFFNTAQFGLTFKF